MSKHCQHCAIPQATNAGRLHTHLGYDSRPLLHVWHIHSYTRFQDSSSPKWCLLLSFWASMKRSNKRRTLSRLVSFSSLLFVIEKRQLAPHWKQLKITEKENIYFSSYLLIEEYLQVFILALIIWHGWVFFFLASSPHISLPASVWEHWIPKWWCALHTEDGGTVHPLHFYRPNLHDGFKWVK